MLSFPTQLMVKEITFLLGIALFDHTMLSRFNLCVSDLPGEEDQDLHPIQEGRGIDALVLAPENGPGNHVLILRTEMKERTASADRKVFPALRARLSVVCTTTETNL